MSVRRSAFYPTYGTAAGGAFLETAWGSSSKAPMYWARLSLRRFRVHAMPLGRIWKVQAQKPFRCWKAHRCGLSPRAWKVALPGIRAALARRGVAGRDFLQ